MATILILYYRAVLLHRPQENGQVVTMMRTTVSAQPQIIIVACCTALRRSAYGAWGNYSVHGADGNLLDISINLEINMQMDYTLKPLPQSR